MKGFIDKFEYDNDSECQQIILDDSTVIAITEEYIGIYKDIDSLYFGEAIALIERK